MVIQVLWTDLRKNLEFIFLRYWFLGKIFTHNNVDSINLLSVILCGLRNSFIQYSQILIKHHIRFGLLLFFFFGLFLMWK